MTILLVHWAVLNWDSFNEVLAIQVLGISTIGFSSNIDHKAYPVLIFVLIYSTFLWAGYKITS